jgi:hypothetical protein
MPYMDSLNVETAGGPLPSKQIVTEFALQLL